MKRQKRIGREQRVFLEADLSEGVAVMCNAAQRNYLINVLRLDDGAPILVFNGRDGEWRARLRPQGKKVCGLEVTEQVRQQDAGPDLSLFFAPLKKARLDYMVQKATELGVAAIHPVFTAHTQAERIKHDRMRANVIEAAEQCGILRIPTVHEPATLDSILNTWPAGTSLIFCDEGADIADPITAIQSVQLPAAVLIGPEGGFSETERARLLKIPSVVRISLGPRIMRADTAAVAALALVNATVGDWRGVEPR